MAATLLLVPLVPSVFASSNSGPGEGDDDRPAGQTASQDPSPITTSITIPLDAESHSAANPYSPNPATVSSGSTITWTNSDDEDQQCATADDGSFSTGILSPGQSGQGVISAPAGNATTVLQPTGPNGTLLQISDQPLAIGHYNTVSENISNNTIQLSVTGNTTITTNDTGNVTITFTESGGDILEGQIFLTTEDGRENVTVTVTEIFSSENAPGRGIASFSTDSTGRLALLDSIVAVTLDEDQLDGSARVSFFEWHAGPLIDNNHVGDTNSTGNQTTAGNQTATPAPAASPNGGGGTVEVSITPGSSSKTDDSYDPNPVQASVGDTVIWTNDDTTPHTVTSGSNAQSDGRFDSSPGLNPLMAPGATFEHTFEKAGEFPYYCALHPNMVGTVSVS